MDCIISDEWQDFYNSVDIYTLVSSSCSDRNWPGEAMPVRKGDLNWVLCLAT